MRYTRSSSGGHVDDEALVDVAPVAVFFAEGRSPA